MISEVDQLSPFTYWVACLVFCLGLWGLLLLRPPQQQQQHHHHHHHRDYYCDYQNKLLRPLCIYFLVGPSTKLKEHPTLLLVVDCLFCSRKGLHTTIPNLFQPFFFGWQLCRRNSIHFCCQSSDYFAHLNLKCKLIRRCLQYVHVFPVSVCDVVSITLP